MPGDGSDEVGGAEDFSSEGGSCGGEVALDLRVHFGTVDDGADGEP